ncbi:ABC transporter permease subunit [Niveibacterium sp. SC-1]|uniref:ABC transporter permease n=1 Tax=Niveibacterium sp. SC-1 TaxID=3135646 RepID=UPI00312001C3
MKPFFPRPVLEAPGNRWDWALLPLVLATLVLLAFGVQQMARPYVVGEALPLSLSPAWLPYYLLRTTLRMFLALGVSLVFSVGFALLAARSRFAGKLLVPLLDILQSIPVLGFLSLTVSGFIALFPGSLLGVECAAIFAIFTSQAWNMAFSLYQSMRTVPEELQEASRMLQLSSWQRFMRLELPFAMPSLLWNMMMSMSGGWFFVVASEAISVANHDIKLPGIGSYIALAIEARDTAAVGWAIVAMLIGILLYDQLFFRPLIAWADKFRFEESSSESTASSWLLDVMRRTQLMRRLLVQTQALFDRAMAATRRRFDAAPQVSRTRFAHPAWERGGNALVALLIVAACWRLFHFVHSEVGWGEAGRVMLLGAYTLVRVVVLTVLAALVWVPVGIWIGLHPRVAARVQPVVQFLAAFPANLMFPLTVALVVRWQLNPEIWLSPLMMLGSQWYLLFNVVAGASSIPAELRFAAGNLGLRAGLKWRRYLLPAVFPSFVTGALTASGGAWNASIVAEYVSWGSTSLQAHGVGSYVASMTAAGDFPRIALGIGVMCVYVMALNHFVWQRLYALAQDRMHF